MTRIADAGPVARALEHLRTPLYRNGYSLGLSTIASSALGMIFWLVAARMLPAAVVGVDSALIAAVGLLGTLAQLNLTHGLNRFVPRAGRQAATLVTRAYALTATLGVLAAIVYLVGIDLWSPSLAFVTQQPLMALWFVVATAVSCVFILQDGVLTGLRRAGWVPIENVAYGVAKLALLAGLVVLGTRAPVFLAWTAPWVAVTLAISWLLYRRLLPAHAALAGEGEELDWRLIRRFVGGDYAASLMSTGLSHALPILVLELTDAESAAYFALTWSVAYTLFLLSRNMGMSLVAEVAHDESRLDEYTYGIIAQTTRLLALPVAVLAVGAPWILRIFGPGYAAGGTTLLRLLAVSALPGIIVSVFMARARIQRRMSALVTVMGMLSGSVLVLSLVLVPVVGVTGVGITWLAAHLVAAGWLLATDLRDVWIGRLDRRVLAATVGVVHRLRGGREHSRRDAQLRDLCPDVASALGAGSAEIEVVHSTLNSVAVATLRLDTGDRVVVKLATDARGNRSLQRQHAVLDDVASDPRLRAWEVALPTVLASGRRGDRRWNVERHLDGGPPPAGAGDAIDRVVEALDALHARTAVDAPADAILRRTLVDDPLDAVVNSFAGPPPISAVRALRAELSTALTERGVVRTARIHGDTAMHNVLFADGDVTALIDWEATVHTGLPEVDRCHLAITAEMERTGAELGDVVLALLREGPDRTPRWAVDGPNALPGRVVVLLTWLHHVAVGIGKSDRYDRSWIWHARNVRPVLLAVGAPPTRPVTETVEAP